MMILLAAPLALFAAMPQPQAPSMAGQTQRLGAPLSAVCQTLSSQKVDAGAPLSAHPLTAEPPAKDYAAVAYSEGGCMKPVIVKVATIGVEAVR